MQALKQFMPTHTSMPLQLQRNTLISLDLLLKTTMPNATLTRSFSKKMLRAPPSRFPMLRYFSFVPKHPLS